MYTAQITIMPLTNLLDPQGKAVLGGLENLGVTTIKDVRVGKHITLQIDATDEATAKSIAEIAAQKLLVNAVMEQYEITIS
jgi:phosphoribosylformylglycinamidine synthase subunit PurS